MVLLAYWSIYILLKHKFNPMLILYPVAFSILYVFFSQFTVNYTLFTLPKDYTGQVKFTRKGVLYFIKHHTENNATLLVPPIGLDEIREYTQRSIVVDIKTLGTGVYLNEWKSRIVDVAELDRFDTSYHPLEIHSRYLKSSKKNILKNAQKYQADYFITENTSEITKQYPQSKNFFIVFRDNDYIVYKIESDS